ncbi:MAG: metalloregulator ArsR/SmtB family transcription factor [Campylobacterales bacterium]|jgi:ArsR family transcriptional regulator|nr:metalloregulator ArsR/SmtB family transcription factor [Campylobacterales bacterium]
MDNRYLNCEVNHENSLLEKELLEEGVAQRLAEFFKIFADPTRIKIVSALFKNRICVCDLAKLLNMSQSATSHQLRLLRQARLVKYEKIGKTVFYSLDDEHIENIFNQGLEHILEQGGASV